MFNPAKDLPGTFYQVKNDVGIEIIVIKIHGRLYINIGPATKNDKLSISWSSKFLDSWEIIRKLKKGDVIRIKI